MRGSGRGVLLGRETRRADDQGRSAHAGAAFGQLDRGRRFGEVDDDVADFLSLESVENLGDKGMVSGLDDGWTSMDL